MIRLFVFNNKILRTGVVLFVLFYAGTNNTNVFAQTMEKDSGIAGDVQSENLHPKSNYNVPSVETSMQFRPKLIQETIEPVAESWADTKCFGEKADWLHANLYKRLQDKVEWFDYLFKPPAGKERIIKLSRFRVGLFGEGKIKKHEQLDLDPLVDFDADIELPNMERRMKLSITTTDPTKLPGRDITEQQDTAVRAAVSQQWRPNMSMDVGVRARWQPELFANTVLAYELKKENLTVYPEQRFYWEEEPGFGEISTLAFDYWKNRWNTRLSTSIKWSEQDRDNDHQSERKDEGFRWSEVFIFGYATELLDETQLGRIVSGEDVARGWGLRLAAFGGFHLIDEYRAGVFYRFPVHKKWMYCMIWPEVNWLNVNNWDREWTIKCGIEILFWGGKER